MWGVVGKSKDRVRKKNEEKERRELVGVVVVGTILLEKKNVEARRNEGYGEERVRLVLPST